MQGKETVLTCSTCSRHAKTTKNLQRRSTNPWWELADDRDERVQSQCGDNARFLGVNLALLNMPAIDMKKDPVQHGDFPEYIQLYLEGRYEAYAVAGMAISLNGMNRQTSYGQ